MTKNVIFSCYSYLEFNPSGPHIHKIQNGLNFAKILYGTFENSPQNRNHFQQNQSILYESFEAFWIRILTRNTDLIRIRTPNTEPDPEVSGRVTKRMSHVHTLGSIRIRVHNTNNNPKN